MIDLIIARLKNGAWQNVIPFGSKRPLPPYIVVKEEPTSFGKTRFRCILHHNQNNYEQLRLYARKNVEELLDNVLLEATAPDTRKIILSAEDGGLSGATILSDDGTMSIERTFFSPDIINVR